MNKDLLLIDYGVGNHQSVINALTALGCRFRVSGNGSDIEKAPAYIFPGMGAFGEAVKNLSSLGIVDVLQREVLGKKKPILGICIGMQLLVDDSEEYGFHKGLGWIPGHVVRIHPQKGFRVPHVGWNDLEMSQKDPLFSLLSDRPTFYFDHSYHVVCDKQYISATAWNGMPVTAAIQKNHIFGVQFHPEKSQRNGLKVLRGLLNIVGRYA